MATPDLDSGVLYGKVFTRAMRGYAAAEVDAYLRDLGDELDRRHRGYPPRHTSDDVRQVTFASEVRGYAVLEVDDFLDTVADELERMERAAGPDGAAGSILPDLPWPDPPGAGAVRFTLAMRGYAPDEVDNFLDRAARELDRLHAGKPVTLSAAEVRAAGFARVARGYAMPEVETYLDDLAREFEELAPPKAGPPPAPALEVRGRQFARVLRGYAPREVDGLLARVDDELRLLRDALAANAPYAPRLTAHDVQNAEFNRAGVRGYAMPEVDAFLDEVAEELDRLQRTVTRWGGA
jgi:DivIVA domain-containing protein